MMPPNFTFWDIVRAFTKHCLLFRDANPQHWRLGIIGYFAIAIIGYALYKMFKHIVFNNH
jgi:hypothetical protein